MQIDGTNSRTEELLVTGVEETKKPLSRIEAILRGEDVKPLSRIEKALKEGGGGGGSTGTVFGRVTWYDDIFYVKAFESESYFTDDPKIETI